MPLPDHQSDEIEVVSMQLPLDRETVSWLSRIASSDVEAAKMVAEMIKMIREDDELAHATRH